MFELDKLNSFRGAILAPVLKVQGPTDQENLPSICEDFFTTFELRSIACFC